jgi:riboflavin synthase
MFTGIIEELGTVERMEPRAAGSRLSIRCAKVLSDSAEGASIAVNGVCLTAVDLRANGFSADLAPETLKRTNLGVLKPGSIVNLERPMQPSGRLSGHIVQGHVDGVGEFVAFESLGDQNWWLKIRVPRELDRYVVWKGSICIDGISLTVASLEADILGVTIIPHTFQNTTLREYRPGSLVNLECDVLAKYVEKMIGAIERPSTLTREKLEALRR